MKKALSFALLIGLILSLFTPSAFAADKKTMVIGDTTFNAENWEETIDPHRTYNGWPCIRYGVRQQHLDHHPARRHQVLFRPRHGRRRRQAVL